MPESVLVAIVFLAESAFKAYCVPPWKIRDKPVVPVRFVTFVVLTLAVLAMIEFVIKLLADKVDIKAESDVKLLNTKLLPVIDLLSKLIFCVAILLAIIEEKIP